MDGQTKRFPLIGVVGQVLTAAVMISAGAGLCRAQGQAMGKAELDTTVAAVSSAKAPSAGTGPMLGAVTVVDTANNDVRNMGGGGGGGLTMPPLNPKLVLAAGTTPTSPGAVTTPATSSETPKAIEVPPAKIPTPVSNSTEPKIIGTPTTPTTPVAGGTTTTKPSEAMNPIESKTIRGRSENNTGSTAATQSSGANTPPEGAGKSNPGWFSMPAGVMNVVQVTTALMVVVGLIFVGRALAKKFVPGARAVGGKGVIEILARHPLAKNQSIVLVRIGSQIVALNQGKEASESVLVISEPTEVARIIGQIEGRNPNSVQAGFNNLLANARMDLEKTDGGLDDSADGEPELRGMNPDNLDEQLDEMAAAKRQLMELRQHVRTVRDRLPRT